MKKRHIKAVAAVCIIIIFGMGISLLFTYRAGYKENNKYIEDITVLTSEAINYRIETALEKPISVSLTIANDILLINWLDKELEYLYDPNHIQVVASYLEAYQNQYGYEAMFLGSVQTNRMYTSNGIDRLLSPYNPEEVWFFHSQKNENEYHVNIDFDKSEGAGKEYTVFVNCNVRDESDNIIAVVGVGYHIKTLQNLIREYEREFGVKAILVDQQGQTMITTEDIQAVSSAFSLSYGWDTWDQLSVSCGSGTNMFWSDDHNDYVVIQYIPISSWYLILEHDTKVYNEQILSYLTNIGLSGLGVLLGVLVVVSIVVQRSNRQIVAMTVQREEERQATFRMVTEQMYDNIYEFDLTDNRAVGAQTLFYFNSLGLPENAPYDDAVKGIAEKRIKKEYRKTFVSMFDSKRILAGYENGRSHLRYEFVSTPEEGGNKWHQIDAYILLSPEDQHIHMFVYLKDIDDAKQREEQMSQKAELDEMTMTYNKSAAERRIGNMLMDAEKSYAFFIIDIDDFKQVNDNYGHAFGDFVIREFASVIKQTFRKDDIVGRMGGDEFVVFISVKDVRWVKEKAGQLSNALNMNCTKGSVHCQVSASIGVATIQRKKVTFEEMYKKADSALYETKEKGKNGYTIHAL